MLPNLLIAGRTPSGKSLYSLDFFGLSAFRLNSHSFQTVIHSKQSFFRIITKMRGFQIARVMALGLASATLTAAADDASYDSSLNFRQGNVTFSDLYHWVGS
jgi:hypothetical protein